MKGSKSNLGLFLLGLWLVLSGLLPYLTIAIPSGDLLLAVLAVVAGVLLMLGR